MPTLRSPWIEQLPIRNAYSLPHTSLISDTVIIGGGIAGITTAAWILKYTPNHVVLLEADQIAHGATGHNAGQITSYFEKPFSKIVSEYGAKIAANAQSDIVDAWRLLDELLDWLDLRSYIDYEVCTGYAGLVTEEQLLRHLEDKLLQDLHGAQFEVILVAESFVATHPLPSRYSGVYEIVTDLMIIELLDTTHPDPGFVALLGSKKGCVNSALLSELMLRELIVRFSSRLVVSEHTPATHVFSTNNGVEIEGYCATHHGKPYHVIATNCILCTNGFTHFTVSKKSRQTVTKSHRLAQEVQGLVGYMLAYHQPHTHGVPSANSYFVPPHYLSSTTPEKDLISEESYFYVTRRSTSTLPLVSIGGPELVLKSHLTYSRTTHQAPDTVYRELDRFATDYLGNSTEGEYFWHGLMGFTKTQLRYIGELPECPHTYLNLGCNGVGILTSVFGGWKISQLLAGRIFEPSVFDIPL